jgi:hypothetical protein
MTLLTKTNIAKLRANRDAGKRAHDSRDHDPVPVVKIRAQDSCATWLFTEIDEDDILFGVCDAGGAPKLGSIALANLEAFRGRLNLPVERDTCFHGRSPLSVYLRSANGNGGLIYVC